ncbi:Uncharacterised protein [Haemophilus parahaemolyticus]|uniref:Uncharacterized protein n=1 Tax=Haemophilus parahaemolyticus TaxID=735 RepID=A0A377I1Y6_HAEPH|nr:hypothetical protein [Haemophilus parahaemolyticus]STO64369.1 Uncharacterised protein [Haemophilus parahaemolyticus]
MTTKMQHPYELFAYQVGQDMKSLIARVKALETQSHGENTPPTTQPATTSGQISVLELRTVVPSAINYPDDEAKLASGDYVVDTNRNDLQIYVGKQYEGWEVNGVKVSEEGWLKLKSIYRQGELVNLTLKSPLNVSSVLYNHIREVDLNHFASVTDFTYKFEHNTLSELKLHGVLENGKAVSRYLNQESDYLQVIEYYNNGASYNAIADSSYPYEDNKQFFSQNGEKPSEDYHIPEEVDYIELTISHNGFSKTITLHNETPKIKGVVLAHIDELSITQNQSDGLIEEIKLKGTNAHGQPEERYLEYGRDKLKVTAFEEDVNGQTSEFVTIDTNAGIGNDEATELMAEVDEYDPNRITNPPRGFGFGVDETKIRLEITTKEGFELSKEVENFKWEEHHQ